MLSFGKLLKKPHHHRDEVGAIDKMRSLILKKSFLRKLYIENYQKYLAVLKKCPIKGLVLELGSGGGFAKDFLPELITSEVIPEPGVDRVVDALKLPFKDGELRAVFMSNVFHHLPDVSIFLSEVERCLTLGGRLLMIDQHPGWFSRLIYQYLHNESFDLYAKDWSFASSGRMSGANGALAWIVFQRDAEKFKSLFPKLRVVRYEPHTPFRYWLSGGLKSWSLLPGGLFGLATQFDRFLAQTFPSLCSFVDIEIEKVG